MTATPFAEGDVAEWTLECADCNASRVVRGRVVARSGWSTKVIHSVVLKVDLGYEPCEHHDRLQHVLTSRARPVSAVDLLAALVATQ